MYKNPTEGAAILGRPLLDLELLYRALMLDQKELKKALEDEIEEEQLLAIWRSLSEEKREDLRKLALNIRIKESEKIVMLPQ